jgi:tRNA(Ile)-lysidine synthase
MDLGLEFITERARLSGVPGNIQSLARDARYGFLDRAASDSGCNKVATGHTMNDQAETYLMRDIRGSGPSGLKGIPPVRGIFIRPSIETKKTEIISYLNERGIQYLTDPTNQKPVYLRNRVRMELLPIIESINPNAVETLARAAEISRVEDEFMSARADDAYTDALTDNSGDSASLDIMKMLSMHTSIRRRVIRAAIGYVKGDLLSITYAHTLETERLIVADGTGKGIDLPGGVRIEIVYGNAVFSVPMETVPYSYEMRVPGRTEVPEAGVTIMAEYATAASPGRTEAAVDPDKLTGPLAVRSRRPGDRFRPLGLGGSVRLKDFFINEKVPRRERDTVPVIVSGDDIVWVAGHRQDGRFAAAGDTENPIRLFLEA